MIRNRHKPFSAIAANAVVMAFLMPTGLQATQHIHLPVHVLDENGAAVNEARIIAENRNTLNQYRCLTDHAGRCELENIQSGILIVRVEKEGFYSLIIKELHVSEKDSLEVTLNHVQEFKDVATVTESQPDIDLAKTSNNRKLGSQEVLNIPYTSTRDFRNVLPILPGVLKDNMGQIHVAGSATPQLLSRLDGFTINQPASGLLDMRISVDALRSLALETTRYSVEDGKGSGGVLKLESGMGDDRYRYSATNFLPSLQALEGLSISKWTPRATFSGPIKKGKVWFFEGADGEYDLSIYRELPRGSNRNSLWRVSSLSKVQYNWNANNILSTDILVNRSYIKHDGLSRFSPLETTKNLRRDANLLTVKNQTFFSKDFLMELGAGWSSFNAYQQPLGQLPYLIFSERNTGNYFEKARAHSRRTQWLARFYLPSFLWHGRHEFKIGAEVDQIAYRQYFERRPIDIFREDGTRVRQAIFLEDTTFVKRNIESGIFVQDRWSLSSRLLLEIGLRSDRDTILRRVLFSPRLSSTYMLSAQRGAKINLGIGIFHNATPLDLITRPQSGRRLDQFFGKDGTNPMGAPVETSFQLPSHALRAPGFTNWSIGLEQRLPMAFILRMEFMQKRGRKGFAFAHRMGLDTSTLGGPYVLQNIARENYDAVEVTVRRVFKGNYIVLASYTRSSARSNAVIDFQINDPVFSRQAGGPLPWDAPHRIVSWGWVPVRKGIDLAYSLEWHTGFPFSLVNQDRILVSIPNSSRFPVYFVLNLHAERRFQWLKYQWAFRWGCNNVTGRENPSAVNNNIDSAQFLTFASLQHRAFTARIRFLGRK